MQRQERSTNAKPRSMPWPVDGETDVVAVDTTWGEMQPLEAAPGVRTVGELELVDMVGQGALSSTAAPPAPSVDARSQDR